MGIANDKTYGSKGSNFDWQKRMLLLQAECCIPTLTEVEVAAFTSAEIGKVIYQTDGTEGLYVLTSSGWRQLAFV